MPISDEGCQQGSSLIISLVLLAVFSIIGIAAIQTSMVNEKMAYNNQLYLEMFQSAESELVLRFFKLKHDDLFDAINSPSREVSLPSLPTENLAYKKRGVDLSSKLMYQGDRTSIAPGDPFINSLDIKEGVQVYHFDLQSTALSKNKDSKRSQAYGLYFITNK